LNLGKFIKEIRKKYQEKTQIMDAYDFKLKYHYHVQEALNDVKRGQHMRFINYIYRTKEVCLAALKSDLDNCYHDRNIHCIPLAIVDEVLEELGKITFIPFYGFAEKKPDPQPKYGSSIKHLQEVVKKRKEETSKDPNYYSDDGKTYEQLLEFYGAKNFEEMLYIRFVETVKREKKEKEAKLIAEKELSALK
jgi:hypothetical protein